MKIHLVGVGGVAMGNLAAMLKEVGHTVSGSDHSLYPPMSDRLREWGIDARPFSADNIGGADLYIVGNAISRGNPEVEVILNRNLDYMSMPQAISHFFLKGREVIVMAGTHGKTTTTFLMDHILTTAGLEPGLFAGGVRSDGMSGFRVGKDPIFVIEGDEYDSAFFDKHSKFLHYRPRYIVLTSVEYDHADIYPDFDAYILSFQRLLRLIPSEGLVAACHDDEGVRTVLDGYKFSDVVWYGAHYGEGVQSFNRNGRNVKTDLLGEIEEFSLMGSHNTNNAMGASIVALKMGIKPEAIVKALQTFPGVMRRQQIRRDFGGVSKKTPVTLIEDFAHHPTAVRETIAAVREAYPDRFLYVLFEPRSATSHRNVFQKRYVEEFSLADGIFLCDIFNRDKVSADSRMDVGAMVEEIRKQKAGGPVVFGANPDDLLAKFKSEFNRHEQGDVILVMSNGAFGGIYPVLDSFVDSLSM